MLKLERWQHLLRGYPDQAFPQLLAGIATHGARVGYEGPFLRVHRLNHASAFRISDEITKNIISEVSLDRVREVYTLPQFYYVISPLGAVEKKANGVRTGWRRIHDLSFPHGNSVNDGIPEHYGALLYQTLDDAIHLIAERGHNVTLRKRDLKDAFRSIPISPYDYWLFLFEWYRKLYADIFHPFGLCTSPFIFSLFSEGLHWILESVFNRQLVHYLDDFLLVNDRKLLGFLSFCARVIPLGRPFLRNTFNFLRKLSHLHPHAIQRLSSRAKRDLQWWVTLLPHWSGIRLINPMRRRIQLYTDASGVKSIGGWWNSNALTARIPRAHRRKLIDWKEAYVILFAFAQWGPQWEGCTVIVMCDGYLLFLEVLYVLLQMVMFFFIYQPPKPISFARASQFPFPLVTIPPAQLQPYVFFFNVILNPHQTLFSVVLSDHLAHHG